MDERLRGLLAKSIQMLLYPLVRILLRNGVPFAAFEEFAKKVYVEVAAREFEVPGRKTTKSRIAVTTGLTRKEVSRLLQVENVDVAQAVEKYGRATRVVSGWTRSPQYSDSRGVAAALPFETSVAPSFSSLVKEFAGDMPPRAVLDELERAGVVSISSERTVTLKERAYLPTRSEEECLRILGTDVADLVSTIDHNMTCTPAARFFQRKVSYDNLPGDCLDELKQLTSQRSQALLETIDEWLARHDRDNDPANEPPTSNEGAQSDNRKRAMLGIYYFEEDYQAAVEPTGEET